MIIDGSKIAAELQTNLTRFIQKIEGRAPCLAVVMVGDNPASEVYVKYKIKGCESVGILSRHKVFPKEISEEKLLSELASLNKDPTVDGILVQLPLPAHINPLKVTLAVDPTKDVDGFHPLNFGKLFLGETDGFVPCTPLGVSVMIQKLNIPTKGRHAVVVGRSNIVGKPMAALLMRKGPGGDATVTVLHSQSENFSSICSTADILIAAIGKPGFIKAEMVKEGAVVIDVGINRTPHSKKLVGDVDYESVKAKCSAITPVPGGVGPMTIAMLLHNTFKSYLMRHPDALSADLECSSLLY